MNTPHLPAPYVQLPVTLSMPSPDSVDTQLRLVPEGGQTYQDCVRLQDKIDLMAKMPTIETLGKLIPGGRQFSHVFTNTYITYAVNDHWQQTEEAVFFVDSAYAGIQPRCFYYPAGTWIIHGTGEIGCGLLSLISTIFGCDLRSAYSWFAGECAISLGDCDVPQMGLAFQDAFIECPTHYGPALVPPHPILGYPRNSLRFTTEFGQNSFWFGVWFVGLEPIGLFCSPVIDAKSNRLEWKFVRPPAKGMLFNKHRIYQEPILPVLICDSLDLAAEHQNSPEFVATWAGGTEYVSEIDWPSLAGRDVTFVTSADQGDTYVVGAELRTIFNRLGTTLECCEA